MFEMFDLLGGLLILFVMFIILGATLKPIEKHRELKSNNEYSHYECQCNCKDGKSELSSKNGDSLSTSCSTLKP